MTEAEWAIIRWFKPEEFDSPDEPGSGMFMQWDLVNRLDRMRKLVGQPLRVTSGWRTKEHNDEIGGVDGSAHTTGHAVDIACRSSGLRDLILQASYDVGITRRGIDSSFIHLDVDPTKPQNVTWLY